MCQLYQNFTTNCYFAINLLLNFLTGSPYESNFLELHPCRTGTLNNIEFYFTMNINERAITTRNQCDLRWNGLPECAFDNGPCPYNGNNSMDEYSVRCRLAIDEENYISSFPIMIGEVDSLPLCPSASKYFNFIYVCNIYIHVRIILKQITICIYTIYDVSSALQRKL